MKNYPEGVSERDFEKEAPEDWLMDVNRFRAQMGLEPLDVYFALDFTEGEGWEERYEGERADVDRFLSDMGIDPTGLK